VWAFYLPTQNGAQFVLIERGGYARLKAAIRLAEKASEKRFIDKVEKCLTGTMGGGMVRRRIATGKTSFCNPWIILGAVRRVLFVNEMMSLTAFATQECLFCRRASHVVRWNPAGMLLYAPTASSIER
jgi:hypothetical protein